MERLTKRETADALKANAEKLRKIGFEPSILDRRYIKLAEYEDREEKQERGRDYNAPWYTYYFIVNIYDPDIDNIRKINVAIFNDRGLTEKYIYMAAMEKALESLINNEYIVRFEFKTRHEWR